MSGYCALLMSDVARSAAALACVRFSLVLFHAVAGLAATPAQPQPQPQQLAQAASAGATQR